MRHGKRYRYYMLRSPAGETAAKSSHASIPAHDLERLVETEWQALLTAKDLDGQLGIDEAGRGKAARQAAKDLARGWDQRSAVEKRQVLINCGVRVEVAPNHVKLQVDSSSLGNLLLGVRSASATREAGHVLTRSINASLHRLRGEVRILGDDPAETANATAEARAEILRTVALGRKLAGELIEGGVASLKVLAARESRAESYLYDVLRAGCLAPAIVESLIAGRPSRYPDMSTFKETFPISWVEQATLVAL